ncbi:MAG: argininosuccinate lyase [Clostridia bacterium]|nr:argininosuccinate lyase [Clostridia bacterium]
MNTLWQGRFQKALDKQVNDFNSSISVDCRMYREDITGSIAHATMLAEQGIISAGDCKEIVAGLKGILADLDSGALQIDPAAEDIHMFVEAELTSRIGDTGKRLHTARSRNDQVALDVRMYLMREIDEITALLNELIKAINEISKDNIYTIMPGYTHLQRAQPISFAHHLLSYAMMLLRDVDRLADCRRRTNVLPLGSCALAGTTYNTDRQRVAGLLGFDSVCKNSIDGVSDRDFAAELAFDISTVMMHLSRFSEEIILWCSWEFKFIELDDSYSTGSSIMPQKKNPDIAELVRGKTGRVYGDLTTLLTMLKGLPLAYNKDMQEDKEAVFDAIDTVKMCLSIFTPMLKTMRVLPGNMKKAAQNGFINATDCADYLVKKGMPFRSAYKITGQLVALCIQKGETLDSLDLDSYRSLSELFDGDIYDEIDMHKCVEKRLSEGGTGFESVKAQIEYLDGILK